MPKNEWTGDWSTSSPPTGPPSVAIGSPPLVGGVPQPVITDPEGPSSNRLWWFVLAGLLVAVLVVGAALAVRVLGEGDTQVAAEAGLELSEGQGDSGSSPAGETDNGGTDNSDTEGGDTGDAGSGDTGSDDPQTDTSQDTAAHIACPPEVPADLCELGAFVEDIRGRPFKTFPVIELEENDEFDRRLLELFDEESDELETAGYVFRSLGLIPADADLVELIRTTLEIGVVGYYDTDTKGLVVRGSEFNLYSKLVLVHELTHAHDDQWIGLDRPEFEESDDEAEFGFLAITEGNASRVDDLWRASLSEQDQEELASQERSALSPEDIQVYLTLPVYILQLQISPYIDGLALVEAIEADGGEVAIDAAFDQPPRTSEQVLDPDQYLSGAAVSLPSPPKADGQVVDEGVFGELGFRHWLGVEVGQGWGGDRYVTWLDGDQACTRIEVFADSPRDLDEYERAALAWASEAPDRTVEAVDDLVRITGCG